METFANEKAVFIQLGQNYLKKTNEKSEMKINLFISIECQLIYIENLKYMNICRKIPLKYDIFVEEKNCSFLSLQLQITNVLFLVAPIQHSFIYMKIFFNSVKLDFGTG